MEHAAAARVRIGEQLGKLDVERNDLAVEAQRAVEERAAAEEALFRSRAAMETLHVDRAARESELSVARAGRDTLGRDVRTREHELAGVVARLKSLEELDAARAEYGDGARMILAESGDAVPHLGSVADYVEVDQEYERAVDAALGDLLQHVVVRTHADAAAGVAFVRERSAGRVGFVVADASVPPPSVPGLASLVDGPWSSVPGLASLVRVTGPGADAIRGLLANIHVAPSREDAEALALGTGAIAVTRDGDVFHGAHRVEGGARDEARSILTTKREIKELRERAEAEDATVVRLLAEAAGLDMAIASADSAIASLQAELHRQEKAIVGFDLQVTAAGEAAARVSRKQEQIALERRSADEELRTQELREDEARQSIQRIETEQRAADEQLSAAQRQLFEAREAAANQSRITAEAKAAHAALVERSSALGDRSAAARGRRARARAARRHPLRGAAEKRLPPRGAPRRHHRGGAPARRRPAHLRRAARAGAGRPTRCRRSCAGSSTGRKRVSARRARPSKWSAARRLSSKSSARPPNQTSGTSPPPASRPCSCRSTKSPPKWRRWSRTACSPARRPSRTRRTRPKSKRVRPPRPAAQDVSPASEDLGRPSPAP